MELKKIVVIVSLFLYALHFLLFPILRTKYIKNSGKLILDLKKKGVLLSVGFYILVVVFFGLILFRNFSLLYTCILCLCGLFGSFLWTKEEALKSISGVYENCLIYGSSVVYFDDNVFFPVFQLPEEDQAHYAKNELRVVCNTKGLVRFVFPTEELCQQIVTQLKEMDVITIDTNN